MHASLFFEATSVGFYVTHIGTKFTNTWLPQITRRWLALYSVRKLSKVRLKRGQLVVIFTAESIIIETTFFHHDLQPGKQHAASLPYPQLIV